MSKKKNLYVGKAGQFAAMSEFLLRGWNVAVPEVDVGDDIFVVRDTDGEFWRIQVKTAISTERRNGFSAQFSLPLTQVQERFVPELTYIFMVLNKNRWQPPVVMSRRDLLNKFESQKMGNVAGDNLILYFSFQEKKIICSNVDLIEYVDNFRQFPVIDH